MKETSKVDPPLRRTPFLEAVAYHEAGHLIAAWRCRIAIKRATIVPKGSVGGSVHHENVLRGIYLAYDASARANDRADKLADHLPSRAGSAAGADSRDFAALTMRDRTTSKPIVSL